MHIFKCWGCGTVVTMEFESPINRVWCPDCREEYPKIIEQKRNEYIKLKSELMLNRALRIIEKQHAKLYQYQEAAEAIADKIKVAPESFASAQEMIAVMELLRNCVKTKIQQNIGSHRVDIVLPTEKAVVEIDGYMHKHSKLKDYQRDIDIRKELGADWEVVRIPVKYIEENVSQLLPAIREIREYKQKTRRQNGGILPKWFSEREAKAWEKAEKEIGKVI